MLHQRYKDIAFLAIAKLTVPNYWLRRGVSKLRTQNGKAVHLHLGCGTKYLPGFVNIDANPFQRVDIWLDVRCGLPFADSSVDSVYSSHVLEHFYPDELQELATECARVLKPGAGMRLVVPSLRSAIRAYEASRAQWFDANFPRHFDSLGGRFSNFVFCDGQHRAAYDFSYLEEELRKAGFREVEESAEGASRLYGDRVSHPLSPATPASFRIRSM